MVGCVYSMTTMAVVCVVVDGRLASELLLLVLFVIAE